MEKTKEKCCHCGQPLTKDEDGNYWCKTNHGL